MTQREIAERFSVWLYEQVGIQSELKHDDGQPDLTIKSKDGNIRLLVENKFWGGLTDAQPIKYLEVLPKDLNSALLFIVPKARMTTVRHELIKRCEDSSRHPATTRFD